MTVKTYFKAINDLMGFLKMANQQQKQYADEASATAPSPLDELMARDVRIGDGGVQVDSMSEARLLAKSFVDAQMVPDSYRMRTRDQAYATEQQIERVALAIAFGRELGFSPMVSLSSIYIVNNKPSIYGPALMSVILNTGDLEWFKEELIVDGNKILPGDITPDMVDRINIVCAMKRKGVELPVEGKFSVRQAKRAGLWQANQSKVPWYKYAYDMLSYAARRRAAQVLFADALLGMTVLDSPDAIGPEPDPDPVKVEDVEDQIKKIFPDPEPAITPDTVESEPVESGEGNGDGDPIDSGAVLESLYEPPAQKTQKKRSEKIEPVPDAYEKAAIVVSERSNISIIAAENRICAWFKSEFPDRPSPKQELQEDHAVALTAAVAAGKMDSPK